MTMKARLSTLGHSANAVAGYVTGGIAAAGSTQATAAAVVDDINVVATVPAGSGVILRSDLTPGDSQIVANQSSAVLLVYPPVGGKLTIGGLLVTTANQPAAIAPGRTAQFLCLTAPNGAATFATFLSA